MSQKHLVYFLCLPSILLYGLFLAIGAEGGFPDMQHSYFFMPFVSDKLIGEDAYYMLTVAWNIAKGEGITYNHGQLTTGIQPLATFTYALIAKIIQSLDGDKFVFARSVFFFNVICFAFFAHIIAKLSLVFAAAKKEKSTLYFTAFSLSLLNLTLFRHFTYGLETGVYLIMFSLTLIYYFSCSLKTAKHAAILGILVGLTGLARIDFGVVFFVFILFKLFDRDRNLPRLIFSGFVALLVVLPWFLFVHKVTGHWIPSSGGAQASLPSSLVVLTKRVIAMILSLADNSIPFIYGAKKALSCLALIVSIGTVFLLQKLSVSKILKGDFRLWLLATFVLILIYPLVFWASHFYGRYSSPIILFSIPAFSILLTKTIKRTAQAQRLLLFLFVSFFVFSTLVFHRGAVQNNHSKSAGYISRQYPNTTVGAFQSGVIGFYNENVYNLDGKLDYEALVHLRSDTIHEAIEQKRIAVIIDWNVYISTINDRYLEEKFLRTESLSNGSLVYTRKNLEK